VLESASDIVRLGFVSISVILWLLVLASRLIHAVKADAIKVSLDLFDGRQDHSLLEVLSAGTTATIPSMVFELLK
jgi:hypothetical protein